LVLMLVSLPIKNLDVATDVTPDYRHYFMKAYKHRNK
jgi:hypothetical protein